MIRLILDRTAVLFLGVAAGCAIGYAFGSGGTREAPVEAVSPAAPIAAAPRAEAPPPPAAPVKPEPAADAPAVVAAADSVTPPPATLTGPIEGRRIRIGVFGDSFGDGVWSGLYRLLPAKDGYEVAKFSQQSTGFTRYARLDLEAHDDPRVGEAPVDIAVIAFGANDAQGVCDGGKCGKLMGSFWRQVIGQRVTSYVGMLRRHGAAVYWVGLPVMRDAAFDADARAMNDFYRDLMGQLGVPFVDIRPLTADAEGRYEAYYQDESGGKKLFRANDGIHMSMNGYIHVTRGLAKAIRASAPEAHPLEAGSGG